MARKRLSDIRLLVEKWIESMPQVTEAERTEVLEKVAKAETWLDEKVSVDVLILWHQCYNYHLSLSLFLFLLSTFVKSQTDSFIYINHHTHIYQPNL
jgi:ribosome-associated translation inhibitor RaiA